MIDDHDIPQGLSGLEDLEVCRALLESQDWDLEATAREHLGIEGEEQQPRQEQPPPPPAPPTNRVGAQAVWRRPQGPLQWVLYLLSMPARCPGSSSSYVLQDPLRGSRSSLGFRDLFDWSASSPY